MVTCSIDAQNNQVRMAISVEIHIWCEVLVNFLEIFGLFIIKILLEVFLYAKLTSMY